MADTKRSSQIPVMTTPRSSSMPSPHLGLVPPSRYPSVSGSPTLPTPASSPSTSSNGGGSTPFRTFRNFLSFGGGKHGSSPSVSALPKSAFTTLGPVRRSVNVERRVSSPQLNSRRSEDDYVLSIDLPRPGGDKFLNTPRSQKSSDPGPELPRTPVSQISRSSRSQSPSSDAQASPTAPALGVTELSTILESETSGISKHLPSLDTSQASHGAESERESDHRSPNGSLRLDQLCPPSRDTRRRSPSSDTSPLDLSTSKLTSEVLAAMSASPGKQDWLNGVVVDDANSDTAISRERTPDDPDASFNLNALDPDLAALLSPNRMHDSEPALLVAIDAIPPPASSSPPCPPKSLPSSSATSPRPSIETQTSPPTRRLPPASLSAAPRRPANSALPRIVRSASDRPAFPTAGKTGLPSPISRTPSGRAMSHSPERPSSMGSVASTQSLARSQRTPSADTTSTSSMRRPNTGGSTEPRKSAVSRLMTPARPSALNSSSSASSSRPPLSRFNSAQGSSVWDAESVSPSSRAPSSIGTAPSRLQEHRPSLDVDRPRPMGVRTRKRSSSVIEPRVTPASPSYTGPRATDWLGPRTQKAFAAAGLLDFDKDSPGSASRPGSRFGTTRSSIERERTRYTPSRMAFSEAGSSSSWGPRSISRATGYVDMAGGPASESMSTPRTTFSSASTAPTSISASSSHLQSELQQLQDRHALETGALLNALADSQRTTKMLREENSQLRERLQFLEDKLADAEDRIRQLQFTQPPQVPPPATRSVYSRRFASPAMSDNRSLPTHSRHGSFLRAQPEPYAADLSSSPEPSAHSPETPLDHPESSYRSHHKRLSGTSSVFSPVPNNMSMIMQEEGVTPESISGFSSHSHPRSSPPGSPTMVLGRVQPPPINTKMSPRPTHAPNKSVSSSAGNISPTTANFSMMTGSPGSLNLRPEHERHLGDMSNLDLADGFEDYDDDGAL